MKKHLVLLSAVLLIQAVFVSAYAQERIVSGDTIRGVIYESAGPMIMTNVTERDSVDRILAHCITDMKGQFSFCLVNPGDRIRVDYIGYESFDTIIDRHYYEILIKECKSPSSADTIDMSKFEHFGITTIDDNVVSVFAQQKPKAGDTISGIVTDSVSPLLAVYITELDSADRVVAYAYTDLKGEFSFRLVNPKDRIQFSFYRKERIILPIDKSYFEIRMEDDKDLPPIDWEDFAPLDSRDVQDAAKAPVLIDISEFEDLGLYTIDEILNAKMGLDLPW